MTTDPSVYARILAAAQPQPPQRRWIHLAALERARGEHAALRSLANAARLLDEHPSLVQLKTLQVVGDALAKGGSTIVIGESALPLRPTGRGGAHAP